MSPCHAPFRTLLDSAPEASRLVVAAVVAAAASIATAQPLPAVDSAPAAPAQGRPARSDLSEGSASLSRAETLVRLGQVADVRFDAHPLQDVVRYLSLIADVPLEPLWKDARHEIGLDPMLPIWFDANGLSVLECIETLLEQAGAAQDLAMGATWQFSPAGVVELGPRERLNRREAVRTEVYDVRDLLATLPAAGQPPRLNLASATLPRRPGSGADDWVFPSDAAPPREPIASPSRVERLIGLITTLVEPSQWTRNGGDAGFIEIVDGALVVAAPDYMHRGLVGPHGG